MEPSADLCRIQEAFQRGRAENSPLGNVRSIAQKAAAAWAAEAVFAADRDRRRDSRIVRAAEAERQRLAGERLDREISENPDRGRAGRAGWLQHAAG